MAEKYSKLAQKYIDILKKKKISENDLNALRSFLNNKNPTSEEKSKIFDLIYNGGDYIELDKQHQQKGIDWLVKQYKTPKGKLKENSPFGTREVFILENVREIRLRDLYDAGNMFSKFYIPLYEVCGGESCFEYHTAGGKINITG